MIELCCSFCGMDQRAVEKLIAGPSVYICNRCVEELDRMDGLPPAWSHVNESPLRCSFCNKSRGDVARMFARTGSLICNQCVENVQEIFLQDRVSPPSIRRRLLRWSSRTLSRCVKFFFPASLQARSESQGRHPRSGRALFNPCLKQSGLVVRRERFA